MARKVETTLVDDMTGDAADETVSFGLDGVEFEIDLSENNAGILRGILAAKGLVDRHEGDEMLGCGDGSAPLGEFVSALDAQLARSDHRETLRPVLAELTPRDRTILMLQFFHQLTQAQIAQ